MIWMQGLQDVEKFEGDTEMLNEEREERKKEGRERSSSRRERDLGKKISDAGRSRDALTNEFFPIVLSAPLSFFPLLILQRR